MSVAQEGRSGQARPGGRTARTRRAVLDAVLAELVEVGWADLAYDRVARRAGVHRATLHRRWPTRADLVADAVLDAAAVDVPVPDTGSLRGDLEALLLAVVAATTSPQGEALLRSLVGAGHDPAVLTVGDRFWAGRLTAARVLVRRGVERGDIGADVDADLLVERLVAPLHLRLLQTSRPPDAAYARRVLDATLG